MSRRRPRSPHSVAKGQPAVITTAGRGRVVGWTWLWCCLVLAPLPLWYAAVSSSRIVQAERALGRGDLRQAFLLATEELQTGRRSDRALMVAGAACLAARELSGARTFLEQVSADDPRLFSQAQRELGGPAAAPQNPARGQRDRHHHQGRQAAVQAQLQQQRGWGVHWRLV